MRNIFLCGNYTEKSSKRKVTVDAYQELERKDLRMLVLYFVAKGVNIERHCYILLST